jgi:hypothetical protein
MTWLLLTRIWVGLAIWALLLLCAEGRAIGGEAKFGIAYFLWHCLAKGSPVYDISERLKGYQPLGPVPAFHWWAKPAAGYYCLSENDELLKQHAKQLAQAGLDFVFIDFTNHDKIAYDKVHLEYLDPLDRLLTVWSQTPEAPKIAPFIPVTATGDLYRDVARRIEQYPDLLFRYLGKPLFLIVSTEEFPVDAAKGAELEERFTTRLMWDDFSAPDTWMFISRCQEGFVENRGTIDCNQHVATRDGSVEQVSVSGAYQRDYMSNSKTAAPRYHGLTFLKQMAQLDSLPRVPIVTILGWNQWIAQRLCVKPDHSPDPVCASGSSQTIDGKPVFTDLYDQEYSTDFEPGGPMEDAYYKLLSCEVKRRKSISGAPSTCALPQ